jgi:hypothetical protein
MEARLAELEVGAEFVKLLHRHRVSAVKVLLNPDGRRAVAAGLAPLAQEIVTTDELLDHKVTTADVANVGRLMRVAQRVAGKDMAAAIEFVGGLFADAEGRTVRDLLSSSRR